MHAIVITALGALAGSLGALCYAMKVASDQSDASMRTEHCECAVCLGFDKPHAVQQPQTFNDLGDVSGFVHFGATTNG